MKLEGTADAVLAGDAGASFPLPGVVPPGIYTIVVGGADRGSVEVRGGDVVRITCAGGACTQL